MLAMGTHAGWKIFLIFHFHRPDCSPNKKHDPCHKHNGEPEGRIIKDPSIERRVVPSNARCLAITVPTLFAIQGHRTDPTFPNIIIIEVERYTSSRRSYTKEQRPDVHEGLHFGGYPTVSPLPPNLDEIKQC
jgi:hypothetical protein